MAIVYTSQNRLSSFLVSNDVDREQSQIIETRKKFNQIIINMIYKYSIFSNLVFFLTFH